MKYVDKGVSISMFDCELDLMIQLLQDMSRDFIADENE